MEVNTPLIEASETGSIELGILGDVNETYPL